jgi:hypothetical protein
VVASQRTLSLGSAREIHFTSASFVRKTALGVDYTPARTGSVEKCQSMTVEDRRQRQSFEGISPVSA